MNHISLRNPELLDLIFVFFLYFSKSLTKKQSHEKIFNNFSFLDDAKV